MDFRTEEEVRNARIVALDGLELQHHAAGRSAGGSLMVANKGDSTAFLSIPIEDLCDAGEGLLISMWLKLEKARGTKIRSALSLNCALPNNMNAYLELSSVPLVGDRWVLLSGWYYHGPDAGRPASFKIKVAPGCTLLLDDLVMTRSTILQPPDKRSHLLVKGANVVENGKPFVLHGVNIYGSSDDEKDDTKHETSSVTEEDYRDIAAAGFNCVRLCLWHKVFRENGGWEWLKLHCLWARRHHLRLILDMHSPPGGYQSKEYKGEFWKRPEMQQELVDFWVKAAEIFKDDPVVAAFDIMNEPKPPKESDWLNYAANTLSAIRQGGWHRPVIIESSMIQDRDGWSEQHMRFDDTAVIYDTHFYTPWSFASAGKSKYGEPCVDYGHRVLDADFIREHVESDLLTFGRKYNVPVNIGEYGVSDKALVVGGDRWLADILRVMNEHGINRQYFCWCVYGDFAIEPGWFRQSAPVRRDAVLKILKDVYPKKDGQQGDAPEPASPAR
jgi:aryl-phospho-beta-D-glucosidase BglC (GH1 family)